MSALFPTVLAAFETFGKRAGTFMPVGGVCGAIIRAFVWRRPRSIAEAQMLMLFFGLGTLVGALVATGWEIGLWVGDQ